MPKGMLEPRYRRLLLRLIEARKKNRLSQRDVAGRLGRPQQFISLYELGGRSLSVMEYVDIATALGLDPVATLKEALEADDAPPG